MTGRARRQQRKRARVRAESDWEVASVRERHAAHPELDTYACTQDTLADARHEMKVRDLLARFGDAFARNQFGTPSSRAWSR